MLKSLPKGRTCGLIAFLIACLALSADAGEILVPPERDAVVLHVAVGGNDAAPGTAERPLETLDGARAAVRRLRDSPAERPGGILVVFADGEYRLKGPVKFVAEDSGDCDCPTIYCAEHPGKAIFSGAQDLDWMPAADEAAARLPTAAKGSVRMADIPGDDDLPTFAMASRYLQVELSSSNEHPLAIYQGDRRLPLARWPNGGWACVAAGPGEKYDGNLLVKPSGTVRLRSMKDDVAPDLRRWAQEPDLWAYGVFRYGYLDSTIRVLSADPTGDWVSVDPVAMKYGCKLRAPCRVFNALCELDEPGEWALDRRNRRVYAWPQASGAVRPRLARASTLVELDRVTDVAFEGFVFECARVAAVTMRNCRDVVVRKSMVRHTSGWGVRIVGGRNCRVEGCDLYDLGEGGVFLQGGVQDTLTSCGHVADNNHIYGYGILSRYYNPAVSLEGVGCRATHNLVHDSDHQAFYFYGSDHYIGYNVVHDVCRFTDDSGAIYCYHTDNAYPHRGTVIEYNLIHETGVHPRSTRTEAIYLDAFSSGITVRGNLVNRAIRGVFLQAGQANRVERNVFMNCVRAVHRTNLGRNDDGKSAHRRTRPGRASTLLQPLEAKRELYETSYWRSRQPELLWPLEDTGDAVSAQDARYCAIVSNACVASGEPRIFDPVATGPYTTLADNRTFADAPGFVDYAGLNWELKPDSPLRALLGGGTRFSQMGLYASPKRLGPVVKFGPHVTPPAPLVGEREKAAVRLSVILDDALPDGTKAFARPLRNCVIARPTWGDAGRHLFVDFRRDIDPDVWVDGTFSFEPEVSGSARFILWGAWGEKTLYDDFRVEGATLDDAGFEGDGWKLVRKCPAYVSPTEDTSFFAPAGVIGEMDGVKPFAGARMAAANANETVVGRIALRRGEKVTVRFKVRAFYPDLRSVRRAQAPAAHTPHIQTSQTLKPLK